VRQPGTTSKDLFSNGAVNLYRYNVAVAQEMPGVPPAPSTVPPPPPPTTLPKTATTTATQTTTTTLTEEEAALVRARPSPLLPRVPQPLWQPHFARCVTAGTGGVVQVDSSLPKA
jgi:hypothetical protein